MNKEAVTKLYSKLSCKELAMLGFHYALDGNELEHSRILKSVPLKDYTCPDVAYIAWTEKLQNLAGFFGITHWRLETSRACVLALVAVNMAKEADTN